MKGFGLKAAAEITGQVIRKEKNGDLAIVEIAWLGATFTIFGNDDVHNLTEVGQTVKLSGNLEVDPKSANNKLRFIRQSIQVQVLS